MPLPFLLFASSSCGLISSRNVLDLEMVKNAFICARSGVKRKRAFIFFNLDKKIIQYYGMPDDFAYIRSELKKTSISNIKHA